MAHVWLVEEDRYDQGGVDWVAESLAVALRLVRDYQARRHPDAGWTVLCDDEDAYRVYLGEPRFGNVLFHLNRHEVEAA